MAYNKGGDNVPGETRGNVQVDEHEEKEVRKNKRNERNECGERTRAHLQRDMPPTT